MDIKRTIVTVVTTSIDSRSLPFPGSQVALKERTEVLELVCDDGAGCLYYGREQCFVILDVSCNLHHRSYASVGTAMIETSRPAIEIFRLNPLFFKVLAIAAAAAVAPCGTVIGG